MNRIFNRGSWPLDVAALLVGVTILLFLFQYHTLAKFSNLPPGLSFVTLASYLTEVRAKVALGWIDGLLAASIGSSCVAVLALELWRKRLTGFLDRIFASDRQTLWLLLLSSAVFVRFYLAPGKINWAGDGSAHLAYAYVTAEAMARGELPIWTNYLGFGSPYIQLYGFLFFYLVGAVDLFLGNLYTSLKAVLFCGHLLSGVGMYAWIYAATSSRRAGFVAGIAFVLGFWHTQQVLLMGRLPLSLFYGLAPWPFFFLERSRSVDDFWPWLVGGGFALGLLAFTHPGYGFWLTIFFGFYWFVRTWTARGSTRGLAAWGGGPVMVALGAVIGAFLTLGIWTERESTHLTEGLHMSGIPDPTVGQVLGWSNFRIFLLPPDPFHWYGGYLGLSLVGVALAGITIWRRHPVQKLRGPLFAGSAALVLALVLVFGYRLPVLQAIPPVTALNSGRYLFFVLFFLSFAAGLSTELLLKRYTAFLGGRLFAGLIIVILVDLGPTTFQHPFRGEDRSPTGYSQELYEPFRQAADVYHHKAEIPNYRIVWLAPRVNPFLAMGRLVYKTATPTPAAPSGHVLRAVPAFYWPFERFASELMQDTHSAQFAAFFRELRTGFALMNTRFVIATKADDGLTSMEWRPRNQILVAPSAGPYPAAEIERGKAWQTASLESLEQFPIVWLARNMQLNFDASTCARIFLLASEIDEDLGTDPEVEVLEHHVFNQRVDMRVRVSAACFARLPYAYYPHLSVSVDGSEVEILQTATRFVGLRLPRGVHRIVLEPRLSPLRRVLLGLDLFLLLGAVLVVWRSVRRSRQQQGAGGS